MLILAMAAQASACVLVRVDTYYPCGSSVNTRQVGKKEALIPLKLVRGGQRLRRKSSTQVWRRGHGVPGEYVLLSTSRVTSDSG